MECCKCAFESLLSCFLLSRCLKGTLCECVNEVVERYHELSFVCLEFSFAFVDIFLNLNNEDKDPNNTSLHTIDHESELEMRRSCLGITKDHEGFSKMPKMTKLTQKKVKFEWGDKQEAAFQLLKQKLCSAPILALPEGSEDFIAYCEFKERVWRCVDAREKVISLCISQLKIQRRIYNHDWNLEK
ncbi:hypothetical protein Tco_1079934 [Tanacetum coccineum]|uniref:Reverse transcriptase domain-containing protein n=1 Tax=Tanacetum coccineum TaxID=301880 RepID=A0ABQ5HTG6_9ASTR